MTEGENGLVAGVTATANKLIGSLPPQFLALLCINVLVIGGLIWFVDARARHTAEVLNQLLSVCLQQKDKTP